jgi:hypothetical protein
MVGVLDPDLVGSGNYFGWVGFVDAVIPDPGKSGTRSTFLT